MLFHPGVHARARRAQNGSGQPHIAARRHPRIPRSLRITPQCDRGTTFAQQPSDQGAYFGERLRRCLRELKAIRVAARTTELAGTALKVVRRH